jgi:hypothetical protein
MNAYITDKQFWLMIDGDGTDYIPDDLFNVDVVRKILEDTDDILEAWAQLRPLVGDYCEAGNHPYNIELIHGYGVRLSANGYLDCTPWEVYTNKKEATQRAKELDRGED